MKFETVIQSKDSHYQNFRIFLYSIHADNYLQKYHEFYFQISPKLSRFCDFARHPKIPNAPFIWWLNSHISHQSPKPRILKYLAHEMHMCKVCITDNWAWGLDTIEHHPKKNKNKKYHALILQLEFNQCIKNQPNSNNDTISIYLRTNCFALWLCIHKSCSNMKFVVE